MKYHMTAARKNWQKIRRTRAMSRWRRAYKLSITGKYTYPEIGARMGIRASTAHRMVQNYIEETRKAIRKSHESQARH